MVWKFEVHGDGRALDNLVDSTAAHPYRVTRAARPGEYFLESDLFEKFAGSPLATTAALGMLAVLNGIARLRHHTTSPFILGTEHEFSSDGKHYVYAAMHSQAVAHSDFQASTLDSSGKEQPSSALDPSLLFASAATSSQAVEKALRLYGAAEHDWVALYRIFEVVKADVGSLAAMEARSGILASKLVLFAHTANSVAAVGDLSRHGVNRANERPPSSPMTLVDASQLIADLLRAWIFAAAPPSLPPV